MIGFIVWLILLIILFGILAYAIDNLPFIEPPFKQTAKALLALVLVLLLLAAVMGAVPMPRWPVA